MENHIKMDDLGVKKHIFGNTHEHFMVIKEIRETRTGKNARIIGGLLTWRL